MDKTINEPDYVANGKPMVNRILIVEDDEGLNNLSQKALSRAGFDTQGVLTGADAIKRVLADPDLTLLLDQQLPDMSGTELIQTLIKQGHPVPFISMTGHGDEKIAVKMMKMGASDYLVKDLDLTDLLPEVFHRLFRELETERRLALAEEELRQREERYTRLFNSGNDAIFVCPLINRKPGKFTEINDVACVRLGYTREELLRMGPADINAGEMGEVNHRAMETLLDTGQCVFEMLHVKKSERKIPVEISSRVFKSKGKNYVLSIARDNTERKKAEEALRESEKKLTRAKKMESLGLLAGGVAHDLNNVLSGIVSYPDLLLLDLPEDNKFRKPIETIQKSGYRAVAIVQDLLTVARGVATTKDPCNLNAFINDYLKSPEFEKLEQFHPAVTIRANLDKDLLNIDASQVHIRKVLMNLVSNAAEAIEGTGNVTLSTLNRYVDMPISGYDDVKEGEYAVLTVSDDGPGILPVDLERIFEPFYTKKVMGRSGTGLGLAVVWNVVQDHKGYINVLTDKSGTIFELYFPITRDEIPATELSLPIKKYKGKGETILVVDDVENQRDITCKMLDILGYKTRTVSSGEEAVAYLKENTVDLILLDMIMDPGINGCETYEKIIKNHPKQKAIIVSGFAETEDVKYIQELGAGKFIKKPIVFEQIGPAVKKELER